MNISPEAKVTGSFTIWVMIELQVPSNKQSPIGVIEVVGMLLSETNNVSIKQWDDPESIRVWVEREYVKMDKVTKRESG